MGDSSGDIRHFDMTVRCVLRRSHLNTFSLQNVVIVIAVISIFQSEA